MLKIKAISTNPARLVLLRRLFPELEIFEGTTGCDSTDYRTRCIPDTYRRLAAEAVAEGWGRETIVMQDDVWMPHGDGLEAWNNSDELAAELVVFGWTDSTGRICPLAFSASPMVWLKLAVAWDGTGRICDKWRPVVDAHGLVLEVAREMGVARSVP